MSEVVLKKEVFSGTLRGDKSVTLVLNPDVKYITVFGSFGSRLCSGGTARISYQFSYTISKTSDDSVGGSVLVAGATASIATSDHAEEFGCSVVI